MATRYMIQAMAKGRPKPMRSLRKSKHIQRWLLRNPWVRPMCAFNVASIKIQKVFRSYYCRRKLTKTLKTRKIGKKRSQLNKYLTFLDLCKVGAVRKPGWLESGYSVWCIVKLQAFFRMMKHRCRYNFRKRVVNQIAAIVLQTAWKNSPMWRIMMAIRKSRYIERIDVHAEARRIQSGWRGFSNKRVYRYLKELVLVKFKGAPADLLRTIIPGEVDLFDKAAGVHVRFRLGGTVFPPKILFKVFTHRALCDVNAFAPRPYKDEKSMEPTQVHNHMGAVPMKKAKKTNIRVGGRYFDTLVTTNTVNGEGWYRRDDRNEWRPIACQIIDENFTPEWMQETIKPKAPKPFHFSTVHRRVDLVKHRKRRKREWLMKAYKLAAGDDLLHHPMGDRGMNMGKQGDPDGVLMDDADPGDEDMHGQQQQPVPIESGLFPHGRRTHTRESLRRYNEGDNASQDTSQQERSVQLSVSTASANHMEVASQHSEDSKQKMKMLTGRLRDDRDLLLSGDYEEEGPSLTKVEVAFRSPSRGAYVQSLTCEDGGGNFEVTERYEEHGALRRHPTVSASVSGKGIKGKGSGTHVGRNGSLPPIGKQAEAVAGAGINAASSRNKLSVFRNRNTQLTAAAKREADLEVYRRALEAPDEDLVKWGMTLDFDAYSNSWACLASSMPSDFDYYGVVASANQHAANSPQKTS